MRETHPTPTTSLAGPPYDHTPSATTLLPPATQYDNMQRNATETRARPRARTHARQWIPAFAGMTEVGYV